MPAQVKGSVDNENQMFFVNNLEYITSDNFRLLKSTVIRISTIDICFSFFFTKYETCSSVNLHILLTMQWEYLYTEEENSHIIRQMHFNTDNPI